MIAIAVPDRSTLVFAEVIEKASALRFTAPVGVERPLHSTLVGLALLAHATPDQQERYIADAKLTALTPKRSRPPRSCSRRSSRSAMTVMPWAAAR